MRSHDWLRALRCLRVAMRCNPNADWWRKALVLAPCFRVAAAAAAAAAAATAGQQGRQGAAPAAAGAKLGPAAAAAAAAAAGSAQLSGINPTQQQPQEPPNAPASSQSLAPSSAPGGAPGAGGAGAGAGGGGKAGGSGLTPLPFLSSSQAYAVPQFSSAMLCEALVDYVMELMEAHAHSKAPGPAPAPQQGAADAAAAAASGAADAPATSPLGSELLAWTPCQIPLPPGRPCECTMSMPLASSLCQLHFVCHEGRCQFLVPGPLISVPCQCPISSEPLSICLLTGEPVVSGP